MKNSLVKKRVFFIIMSLVLTLAITTSAMAAGSVCLTLNFQRQQSDVWCWAAVSQSIIDKVAGRWVEQSDINYNIFQTYEPHEGSPEATTQALWAYGVGNTFYDGPRDFSDIVSNIDNQKPMKAGVAWQQIVGGHALLIYGYYNNEEGSDPQVYYLDPLDSHPLYSLIRYTDFRQNLQFAWNNTNYNCYKTY